MRFIPPTVFLIVVAILLVACSGPTLVFPGGALDGPEASIASAKLSGDGAVIQLETRPDDPYSVNVNALFIDGAVYVDPSSDRAWFTYMDADPNVRVKLQESDKVYTAIAVPETDPGILSQFEADRRVMRLEPRR